MARDLIQSLSPDLIDVGIVHSPETMAHDDPCGIRVLSFIRNGGERVPQSAEGNPIGKIHLQIVGQIGEDFGNGVDVGFFPLLHPGLAVALPEYEIVAGPKDGFDGLYGFWPEGNHSGCFSFVADGVDDAVFQVNIFDQQAGAIGSAEAPIDPKQDHGLELSIGALIYQLSHVAGIEQAAFADGTLAADRLFLKPLAHSHGVTPATIQGVVEHRHDAGPLAVECVGAELRLGSQMPTKPSEVLGAKVSHQASGAEVFQESTDGVSYVRYVSQADITGCGLSLLLVGEQIGQLLTGQGIDVDGYAGLASGVQIPLDQIVFRQGDIPVAAPAEVVELALDSLLESAIGAGLGGESFHRRDLVTIGHTDKIAEKSAVVNGIRLSSQPGFVKLADMQNQLILPAFGSVAQRQSRGLIIPSTVAATPRKSENSQETPHAHSAESPESSGNGSRKTTGKKPSLRQAIAMAGGPEAIKPRFERHVVRSGDCWIWDGKKSERGYGRFGVGRFTYSTHRVSCFIYNGPFDLGLCVMHSCDNPACVNPAHLKTGTLSDNMQDCAAKGRCPTQVNPGLVAGELNGQARLMPLDVLFMRSMSMAGHPTEHIANLFGVHKVHANRIISGRKWKTLPLAYPRGYGKGVRLKRRSAILHAQEGQP